MKFLTPHERMDLLSKELDLILSKTVINDVGNLVKVLDKLYTDENDSLWCFKSNGERFVYRMDDSRLILYSADRFGEIIREWDLED
jgi:hypothetical protein